MLVLVGLGSNLEDRAALISAGIADIQQLTDTELIAKSSLYETAAVGGPAQSDFLNAVILIETKLSPELLLIELQQIENLHGRTRTVRWGPRTLDLDIIDIEGFTSDTESLKVPHPLACEREFVLRPAAEIAPDWKLQSKSIALWLEQLTK